MRNRAGRRQRIRLGSDRWLHLEKRQQVSKKESLVANSSQSGENLLDIAAGLKNRASQERQGTDTQLAGNRPPDHEYIGCVIAHRSDSGKRRTGNQLAPRKACILRIDLVRQPGKTFAQKASQAKQL